MHPSLDGFDIKFLYLFLVVIPLVFVFLAIALRTTVEGEKDKKRAVGNVWFWIVPAGLLGLLTWFFLRPVFADNKMHIFFYGILITLGVIAAAFVGQAEAKRRGLNADYIWDALFWIVLAGIAGARLWHVFSPPPSMVVQGITTGWYFLHPFEMVNIRNGGLGIPGGIIGGGIALWFYCRNKKIPFSVFADAVIPGVALAQAIGRWGNFFNQEVYGGPTNLPWKLYIDPLHRVQGYEQVSFYHPLFLYECLWNLLNMAFLLFLARRFEKWLKPGDIFLSYMIIYAIGRFSLEFLRLDASQVGGINFNQTFMVIVMIGAGAIFFLNHRLRKA
jgi:phosphatidylglycerol---prolipoprotein diacylglyceryl transferase